ncbi:AF4/FMR2 family member 4 [Cyclospora cayetanensis]|uniref:AF4/FMR2 family member 4 n=1 Tax=Cyclospora cayetanensis TaxID=88456 RepID=A0A6P6S061_9EIME|nr:AF4/FMR2 family member 4 [Cyclospora cayetanensis]
MCRAGLQHVAATAATLAAETMPKELHDALQQLTALSACTAADGSDDPRLEAAEPRSPAAAVQEQQQQPFAAPRVAVPFVSLEGSDLCIHLPQVPDATAAAGGAASPATGTPAASEVPLGSLEDHGALQEQRQQQEQEDVQREQQEEETLLQLDEQQLRLLCASVAVLHDAAVEKLREFWCREAPHLLDQLQRVSCHAGGGSADAAAASGGSSCSKRQQPTDLLLTTCKEGPAAAALQQLEELAGGRDSLLLLLGLRPADTATEQGSGGKALELHGCVDEVSAASPSAAATAAAVAAPGETAVTAPAEAAATPRVVSLADIKDLSLLHSNMPQQRGQADERASRPASASVVSLASTGASLPAAAKTARAASAVDKEQTAFQQVARHLQQLHAAVRDETIRLQELASFYDLFAAQSLGIAD